MRTCIENTQLYYYLKYRNSITQWLSIWQHIFRIACIESRDGENRDEKKNTLRILLGLVLMELRNGLLSTLGISNVQL